MPMPQRDAELAANFQPIILVSKAANVACGSRREKRGRNLSAISMRRIKDITFFAAFVARAAFRHPRENTVEIKRKRIERDRVTVAETFE